MRFREADFESAPEIVHDSKATWPFSYRDLEPHYDEAEQLLDISGESGTDPTEPARKIPYPQQPGKLSVTSGMIQDAARSLKLKPFRLPLAINYTHENGVGKCIACPTCDTFACAIEAKNDLATRIIPKLTKSGMTLQPSTIAVRLNYEHGKLTAVECYDKIKNERISYSGKVIILSAGALASPHLLLASELEKCNPGGRTVGRYLTRHCNAIAFGFFRKDPNPEDEFHKQIGIHDFYFGHPTIATPEGKLGSMQQLQTPPVGLVEAQVPWPLGKLLALGVPHLTGLLVMAEDQPQFKNGVEVDFGKTDRFGLPELLVSHEYSERDLAARGALVQKAKQILKEAGALFCYVHNIYTFSHAVGTVRMGSDPEESALDEFCQFRGIENLYVVDGSFFPTSGGLNPSLTISANALRVGEHIVQNVLN
jgi:choline dehydrogenase-like flavoprotein